MNPLSFQKRAQLTPHPLTKKLFSLMEEKQSNLSLAADVTKAKDLLELADLVGPHICMLKTHIDILDDFNPEVSKKLQQLAMKHQFLIFEDRKFADIGNTVMQQYQGGIYRISEWSHLINAHPLVGSGLIEGLQKEGLSKGNGLLLIAQLSSKENLINEAYTKQTVDLALRYSDFIVGFICQKKLTDHPAFLHLTPGIQIESKKDGLGQQYNTPESAMQKGTDIIIVGRGITHSKHPLEAAQEYQKRGWQAYMQIIS